MRFMASTAITLVLAMEAMSAPAAAQDAAQSSAGSAQTAPPAADTTAVAPSEAVPQATRRPPSEGDIVVTGSRLVANGERAPTPVTVVSSQQLRDVSPSITEAVRQLPQLTGSSSPSTATLTIGGGPSTLDSPNLRNLGANRTLTLLDGRRPPVSGGSGTVDTSVFPQLLIKRVDIVTGGASATYGSDAVSGVVNYIVDTSFKGLAAEVRGGLSTHGDAESMNAQLAGGTSFADDKGRIVFNANLGGQNGLFGDERSYNQRGIATVPNPLFGQPGQPQLLLQENVTLAGATFGGKIITPALANIQFDGSGNPVAYTGGTINTGTLQVGGDGARYAPTLVAKSRQWSAYGHAEYDLSPAVTVFVEGSYGYANTQYPNLYPFNLATGAYVIRRDNAFLPTSVAAAMDSAGLASFQLGKIDLNYGRNITRNRSETLNGVAGFRAKLPGSWALDGYYSYGESDLTYGARNNRIQAPSRLASDAVRRADGTIVCRSTLTAPANGCVPINPFGTQPLTDEQRAYVIGVSQAESVTRQHVVSGTLRGEPFSLWAGPLGLAIGAEYRSLSLRQVADPIGQANGFTAANLKSSAGKFDVKEVFAEVQVPLLRDVPLAQSVDFNGAIRRTDYSTSGAVTTWKVGLTDQIFDDLRVRATYSQDIRAPNISELFGGVVRSVANVRDYAFNGQIFNNIDTFTGSNSALSPEVAKTLTLGGVYRPAFISGLGLSVDYYKLKLRDAITQLGFQAIVDQCGSGSDLFCGLITRSPTTNQITAINGAVQNVQSASVSGIDFEANYTRDVGSGKVSVRALATYLDEYRFETPGAGQIEQAGTGVLPKWRGNLQLTYSQDALTIAIQERFVGPLRRATPPVTIDDNSIPATFYTNATIRHRLDSLFAKPELFLTVANLFNQQPRIGATNSCNLGICQVYDGGLYDVVGRYFTLGLRARL